MKFRSIAALAVTACAALSFNSTAQAAVTVFELPFIGDWNTYSTTDTSLTFSGTGFVGMYGVPNNGADAFVALFGVEESDYSRTHAQVDIIGLTGVTVNSAILSFDLLEGSGTQRVQVTGYSGTGALGFQWDAPGTNYGDEIFNVTSNANALDITALLAASVAAGDVWFNLHLQGLLDDVYLWTYTDDELDIDRANVRLTVDYSMTQDPDPIDVPAPAGLGLMMAGLIGFAAYRRRSR